MPPICAVGNGRLLVRESDFGGIGAAELLIGAFGGKNGFWSEFQERGNRNLENTDQISENPREFPTFILISADFQEVAKACVAIFAATPPLWRAALRAHR